MRALLTGLSLLLVSCYGYSRDIDSPAVNVRSITAYWAQIAPNTLYSYTFTGLSSSDSCGKEGLADAISGDSNINRILQMAYSLNEKVKVSIDPRCKITTVILSEDN
ncbi:TPA: hypothetical protein MND73_000791 [Salmonella enterica subsp. houtenae]|nr:hypothetical protein [Salmonella enterica subsp. houtenae]